MNEQPAWRLTDEEIQSAFWETDAKHFDDYGRNSLRSVSDAQARRLVDWLRGGLMVTTVHPFGEDILVVCLPRAAWQQLEKDVDLA